MTELEKSKTNKLIVVGIINPANNDKWHQRNQVYDELGICCCTTSTMYKDPPRVLVRRK